MIVYPIVEIFYSLQGEGANTGMPAIFIRFGRCNLACQWCDTHFTDYQMMTQDDILKQLNRYHCANIIITGGEPTLQHNLKALVTELKKRGYFIAIETNGLRTLLSTIDYIAVSPKFSYRQKYHQVPKTPVNEVRIVVEEQTEFDAFCLAMSEKFVADYYFLSPCEVLGNFNLLATMTLLGRLNQQQKRVHWLLSLQTHKLANIE